MNQAIFQFSFFQKFKGILDWLILASFLLGPGVLVLIAGLNTEDPDMRAMIASAIFGLLDESTYLLLIAFIFVSDGLVGRRIIGDAAPLSLVFTRPITRISYVFSKWLAGSLGMMCMLVGAALCVQLAATSLGVKEHLVDGYVIATMILTSMGYAALMVFLHCLPGVLGPITFVTISTISTVGKVLASVSDKDMPWYALVPKQVMLFLSFWLDDFTRPTLDVFTLLTSVVFDWNAVIVFVSSIIIFLVAGTLIMGRREFFYATS